MSSAKLFNVDTVGGYEKEQVDRYVEMLQNAYNTMKEHIDEVDEENVKLRSQLGVAQNAIRELQQLQNSDITENKDRKQESDALSAALMRANSEMQQLRIDKDEELLSLKRQLIAATKKMDELSSEQESYLKTYSEEESKQIGKIIIDANSFGDKIVTDAKTQADKMIRDAQKKVTDVNDSVRNMKMELSDLKSKLLTLAHQVDDVADKM